MNFPDLSLLKCTCAKQHCADSGKKKKIAAYSLTTSGFCASFAENGPGRGRVLVHAEVVQHKASRKTSAEDINSLLFIFLSSLCSLFF